MRITTREREKERKSLNQILSWKGGGGVGSKIPVGYRTLTAESWQPGKLAAKREEKNLWFTSSSLLWNRRRFSFCPSFHVWDIKQLTQQRQRHDKKMRSLSWTNFAQPMRHMLSRKKRKISSDLLFFSAPLIYIALPDRQFGLFSSVESSN